MTEEAATRSATATEGPLLSPEFMRKLDRWSLAVRRVLSGQYSGERRSSRHGQSVEFADFRNYVSGDDLRFIDWNLYARLERMYLKLFLHEQELNVHVMLDLSESMTFGDPPKSLLARKLAAALGYLALARQDGLSISVASEKAVGHAANFRLSRGRGFVTRMMWYLQNAPEGGAQSLTEFAQRTMLRIRRPGLVILITDFLGPEGYEAPLKAIASRRHEIIVMHVLDREEWEPTVRGDLKLVDSETGAVTEISATPAMLARYRARVESWSDEIQAYCSRRGMTYIRLVGEVDPEEVILKSLRQLGRIS